VKHIEKRILLLERTYRPDPEDGGSLQELLFLYNFHKVWPDPKAAPKFALAECRRIGERFGSKRAKAAKAAKEAKAAKVAKVAKAPKVAKAAKVAKAKRTGAAKEALDG
jgi:hypothetical protein